MSDPNWESKQCVCCYKILSKTNLDELKITQDIEQTSTFDNYFKRHKNKQKWLNGLKISLGKQEKENISFVVANIEIDT